MNNYSFCLAPRIYRSAIAEEARGVQTVMMGINDILTMTFYKLNSS